jgi:signal transduction histidine kinase
VEDNPGDVRLLQLHLDDGGEFEIVHADTLATALAKLTSAPFDIVLLDLTLPDSYGRLTFERVRAAAPDVPVVVVTGLDDEATAVSLVVAGAQDYLVKGALTARGLRWCLRHAIERHRLLKAVDAARQREAEQKDRFLSHISHELRSPLAVSLLYTTNVMDGVIGELTPEQREHLAIAVEGLKAQSRLIDELLATVRSDSTLINIEPVPVALSSIVAQTVRGFGSLPNGVLIDDDTAGDLPPVYADPQRVRQMLTNLIDNALKFSPAGTKVRVQARPAREQPGFVRVDVEDEGSGVPDDRRERIFDCLFQDETAQSGQRGLGLGLYLCKLLVARHGGRIWIESREPRGSRFSFTLPFLKPSATAPRLP